MKIKSELLKIYPSTSEQKLNKFNTLQYDITVPAFDMVGIVCPIDDGRGIELLAKDSYDSQLAGFLLVEAIRLLDSQEETHAIIEKSCTYPKPYPFDAICVAPPIIAQRHKEYSEKLTKYLYWVFPAFMGEFPHGSSGDYFQHQLHRKDDNLIAITRWDRLKKWKRKQSLSSPKLNP